MNHHPTLPDAVPADGAGLSDDGQVADQLRNLARRAAPTITAPADLATTVLAASRRPRRRRRAVVGIAGGVLVIGTVAATTLVGTSDYDTATQPSTAMTPTIGIGERVILNRSLRPATGDIVRVHLTRDGRQYDSILRVVALGGDTVGCPAGPDGRCPALLVNGHTVPEPYLAGAVTDPFPVSTVPAGTLFLLGDNRAAANDSRFVGPVRADDVTGVAVRLRDTAGHERPVPGAPAHDGPGDRDNVDPARPVPPAEVATPE